MAQDRNLEFPYPSGPYLGYVDHFSEESVNTEPLILEDGTSVIFPKGWTDEDADKWRKGMELQRLNDFPTGSYETFH